METKERQELAVNYNQSHNCCQSVLLACRDLTGMDEKTAESIGSCFAGGMFSGEVCGAVTGGLMALGACLPGENSKEKKPQAVALGSGLQKKFREEFGSTLCREILKSRGKKVCDECVACSAGIVNDLVEELKSGN